MFNLNNLPTAIALFVISGGFIFWAGRSLVRNAEALERETDLTRLWIGSVVLAGATSLPELVASLSAGSLGLPDLAVGNLLGSNVFNLAILAILDPLEGRGSLLRRAAVGHLLPAAVGIIMSALVGMALLARLPYSLFGIGIDTILIALVYLFSLWLLGRYERRPLEDQLVRLVLPPGEEAAALQREATAPAPASGDADADGAGMAVDLAADGDKSRLVRRAWVGLAGAAIAILCSGTMLTVSAEAASRLTGIGSLFIGSVLVAAVTSLPEVVTSAGALRGGAIDLAVGTVLGSNLFNLMVLFLADVFYRPGPLLAAVSPSHALTALAGLLLTGITLVGLIYRSRRDYAGFGPDTLFILGAYVAVTYFLFIMG